MCGIAGIMVRDGKSPDASILETFARALGHRGPDGEGKYLAGAVAMVQTRLAVIDLKTGDQPIYEAGGGALIANAEIYNYLELRATLGDIPQSTQSDCEPPLHLYRRDGLSFTESLRGMYAIAIHDPAEAQLILARDPFGIKPLYYVETEDHFAFASEPQALLAAGVAAPELAPERRNELLQLQFTCGRGTIFKGINRVLPGETLIVRGGRIVERRRRTALPAGGPEECGIDEGLRRLDAALEDSVLLHQRSDVPYGLFLSGGIDSSTMLALMSRLNERPVKAYTAGFTGTAVADERDHARELAKSVGAEFHAVDFTDADFWSLLPEIAGAMDDPAADYAILPTWKLAREAARDLKVVISGEGGDELLGGYGRYRSALRPWWQGGRMMRARGIVEGLGILREDSASWRDAIAASEVTATEPQRSRLQIAQAVDITDWLPNDLLTKLDRCLMAHGMEGRTPFLDTQVAEAVFRLPDSLKIHKQRGKWILRRWLDRVLPAAGAFERKRGFTVPVGEWIFERGAELGPLVAANPAIAEACHSDRVIALFKSTKKRARLAGWVLLFYALWHRQHVQRRQPEGDVFDVLSTI
ncbi:MAG: asparagine synthase (glutamine-hydrolyzing) [Rhodospirillaceae bacterium]|nr:asparagine synthase (glutamine-hydrolyzing) [Rhodospirillaceae bacterium]MDD9925813.1 asparagine synthase (glutamine-hydrolyzing) [Rhodospirillaceae bacterium]